MDDTISRQDAISLPVKPKEDRYFQTQNLDDAYEYGWRDLQGCIEKLPSAQPDLSGYSDRLWKAAYERGKSEAQADIIHCGECKYYGDSDGCFFSTATTGANGFCHWAERKEGEADADTEV